MKIVQRARQTGTIRAQVMPYKGTIIVTPETGGADRVFTFEKGDYIVLEDDVPHEHMTPAQFEDCYPIKVDAA